MNKFVRISLVLCFALCLANVVSAATYTVSKIADTNDGACDADCSLREAIAAAGATIDDDIIEFSSTVFNAPQTIVLSGTDLIINSNGRLAINGTGTELLTVSGNNVSRVFTNNTGAITEIRNMRVTGGTAVSAVVTGRGGGIYNNAGQLTLSNMVITGNSAANGGGVNNAGTATLNIVSSTISGNTATGSGGGAQNFSGNTMNIFASTFSGNTCSSTGTGGGALQANGTLDITNSTFSGNTANGGSGGGIYYNGQGLTMHNTTITANTSSNGASGFHKSTSTNNANLRNNLIAGNGNSSGTSPDVSNVINSLGNNLIGAVGASTGWVASDILGQAPLLAPLANNGGSTLTHALLSGSPAINAGNNCVTDSTCSPNNPPRSLLNDQRGVNFPRQVGTAVDIGAYEFSAASAPRVAAFDFDGDGKSDYGVFRPSNGTWFLNRSTAGQVAVPFGLASDRLTPADFDGDGKTDIAVWRSGDFAYFYILQSSNNTFRAEQFGKTGDDPAVVGYWDGDNKADIAVYRSATTSGGQSFFFYRPSTQPGVNFNFIQWGTLGDEPLRGDFDGDGRGDAAVFRASDNIWYIRQSSSGQPRYERWGFPSDKRVEGDFDGDGKTDLAIYSSGYWYVLQSSNSQLRREYFGLADDRVTPGDYNGDGKTDFCVWRRGIYYVLRSNDGQVEVFQYGASTDEPFAAAFVR